MVKLRFLLCSLVLLASACGQRTEPDPLTPAERRWLEEHADELRLAPTPNYPPIDFFDRSGQHQGIAAEHFELIEKRLDVRFKRVPLKSWDEILKKAKAREIDLTTIAQKTKDRSEYLRFTKPYLTVPTVIITRRDGSKNLRLEEMAGMSVAVVKGYAVTETVLKNHPGLKLVFVANDEEGLMKVALGQVDAMLADLAVAVEYIENKGISNLQVAGQTGHEYHYSIASRKDMPQLQSILNKGLALITEEERHAIRHRWFHLDETPPYKTREFWTLALSFLGVIVILVSVAWNWSLRKIVNTRTAELERELNARRVYEKSLKEAKESAILANKAKTAFLSNMSHEIRTPLNAILGMTSLLLRTSLNNEQLRYSQVINQSGDALLTLINNVLDLSKIEAGEMELDLAEFCIQECLHEALSIVSPLAIDRGNTLILHIEKLPTATAIGDSHRLRQVLVNLLSNALKSSSKGTVELVARGHSCEKGEDYFELELAVVDDGVGLSSEDIERVFQSFQQVKSGTQQEASGTGLGLPICVKLLDLMDGQIHAESPGRDQGASFVARVPLKKSLLSPYVLESEWSELLTDKKIILMEPGEARRRELKECLESAGMRVEAYESLGQLDSVPEPEDSADLVILGFDVDEGPLQFVTNGGRIPAFQWVAMDEKLDVTRSHRLYDAVFSEPVEPEFLLRKVLSFLSTETEKPRRDKHEEAKEGAPSILVVEDNPINQEVTLSLLGHLSYTAELASSGEEALETLNERSFDVIFMDIQMEGMDGVETTRRIRERNGQEEQPWIIALTANALGDQRDRYLAEGMNDYLSKPFRSEDLSRVLERARQGCSESEDETPGDEGSAIKDMDWETLKALYEVMGENAEATMETFIQRFLENMDASLERMAKANDQKTRAEVAHGLYGSAMMLGVQCVGAVCMELQALDEDDPNRVRDLELKLQEAGESAKRQLNQWPQFLSS